VCRFAFARWYAIRVARCTDPGPFFGPCREFFSIRGTLRRCSWITAKRPDGRCNVIRAVWLPMVRNGAHDLLLVCLGCNTPRRYLYGWEASGPYTSSVETSHWLCRLCARLRFSSEGGFLRPGALLRSFGNLPRSQSWFPYVFTSIDDRGLMRSCDAVAIQANSGSVEARIRVMGLVLGAIARPTRY
jgi:hypothetical protein